MVGAVLLGMVCTPLLIIAQNEARILVVSKFHRNANVTPEPTPGEWRALEKEYFDKVTMKNEYIVGANTLVHYFTDDNSEILFLAAYKSWEDIEKAGDRNNELARAAWPDSVKRQAFFTRQNSFYTRQHADEIMSILPYQKWLAPDTNRYVFYIRTGRRGYPKDGNNAEFRTSMTEVLENLIKKNDLVKRYLIAGHMYGADSRQIMELMTFNSLSDLEKSFEKDEELAKAHWPDEAKRKAFFDGFDKYFSPWHSDAIYHNVPGLRK